MSQVYYYPFNAGISPALRNIVALATKQKILNEANQLWEKAVNSLLFLSELLIKFRRPIESFPSTTT